MKTAEKILREYVEFADVNGSKAVKLLPLTIIDAMIEYAGESRKEQITPEVEEFVKWTRLNYKLALTIEGTWRSVNITAQNIEYTTSELFDWWKLNVKK